MESTLSFAELPESEQARLRAIIRSQVAAFLPPGLRRISATDEFDAALAWLRDPASKSWRDSARNQFGVSVPGLMQAAAAELYPRALPLLDQKKSPPERALIFEL